MTYQRMLRTAAIGMAMLAPVSSLATPFIEVQGRIDEVESQRTSSLLGHPGLFWFRMSDGDRWIFVPPDTYSGVAAASAVSTMNTLGSDFFWRVPGGAVLGSVNFTLNVDPADPQGSALTRDYNKLRSVTMNRPETPDQYGSPGLAYISYLSVSLESNRAYATVSVVGSNQQQFLVLSTPGQVSTAVFALSKKKPVSFGQSCAYIYNMQTSQLDTVCDAAAWLHADS